MYGRRSRLVYLPPYSPDLNPIKEHFGELKAFIRHRGKMFMRNRGQDFKGFLKLVIIIVGRRIKSARGHCRHSRWVIKEVEDSPAAYS
jgi:DDE superfamily endonuclease